MARSRRSGTRTQRIEPSFDAPSRSASRSEGRVRSHAAQQPRRRKAKRGPRKGRGGGRGWFGRFLARSIYWGFVLSIWGVIGLAGVIAYHAM